MKKYLKLLRCAIVGAALTCQLDLNAMFSEKTIDVGDGTTIKIIGINLQAWLDVNKVSTIYKNVIEAESPEEKFQELSVIHDMVPGVVDPNEEVKKIVSAFGSYCFLRNKIDCSSNYLRSLDAEIIAEKIFINGIFDKLSDKFLMFMGQSIKNLRNKAVYDPEGFKQEFIEFFEQPLENMINKFEAAQIEYPEYEDFLDDCFNDLYYITSKYYKYVIGATQPDEKLLELASIHKEALGITDPIEEISQMITTYSDYHLLHTIVKCSADELRELDAEIIAENIFIEKFFNKLSAKSSWFMGQPIKNLRNEAIYDPEGFKSLFIEFFDQPAKNMPAMIKVTKHKYPEFSDLIDDLISEASYRVRLIQLVSIATPSEVIDKSDE